MNYARSKDPAYESVVMDLSTPWHAADATIRCQKVAAAARATTVLKQCNELDYAPRDLMRRANVAQ